MPARDRKFTARFLALAVIATLLVPAAAPSQPVPAARAANRAAPQDALLSVTRDATGQTVQNRSFSTPSMGIGEAVKELGRYATPQRVLASATRIRLEQTLGRPIADPVKLLSPQTAALVVEDIYTWRGADPAGDLDGDGTGDVLTYDQSVRLTYDFDTGEETFEVLENRVTGRRGIDGAILWTADLAASADSVFVYPLRADLNGDGRADVMAVSLAVDDAGTPITCAPFTCAGSQDFAYHYTVQPQRGDTRAPIWSKTIPGQATLTVVIAYPLLGGLFSYGVRGTAVSLDAAVVADHNADGSPDVLLNVYDADYSQTDVSAFALVAFAIAGIWDDGYGDRASVVAGDDGSVLLERTHPAQELAVMVSFGDATGDGIADLLWITAEAPPTPFACAVALVAGACVVPGSFSARFQMIDTATGNTAWTKDLDEPSLLGFLLSPSFDGDGDGRDDVAIIRIDRGPLPIDEEEFRLQIHSGADGSTLWSRSVGWELIYFGALAIAGPVGGGAGDDLIAITVEFLDSFDIVGLRIDGATGEDLFSDSQQFEFPQSGNAGLWAYVWIADADGDGTGDVMSSFGTELYDDDWGLVSTSADVAIDSGVTGQTIFEDHLDQEAIWAPGGDLNGDGVIDVARTVSDDTARTVELAALSMPSGATAFARTDSFGDFDPGSFWAGGIGIDDLDGVSGGELAYIRYGAENLDGIRERVRIDMLAGSDGTVLWGFGDAIGGAPPPPPVPGGTIAGTVTGAEGPLEGIGVYVYGPQGGATSTGAAGQFAFPDMPPGSYAIAFIDDTGRYAAEWYDDAVDQESATPVVVVSGVTTIAKAALALVPPPANDSIAAATVIDALPYNENIQTGGATTEPDEPSWCGTGNTIWYRYTPPVPGPVVAEVHNRSASPALAVYEGTSPSALSITGCADAGPSGTRLQFWAMPGTTYWIQIGEQGGGGSAHFELRTSLT